MSPVTLRDAPNQIKKTRSFIKLAMCPHFAAVDISRIGQNFAIKPVPASRTPGPPSPNPAPTLPSCACARIGRRRGSTCEDTARRVAVLRRDMDRNQLDRRGEDRGIISEANERQHIGNEVERQHKVRERADQGDLNPARRVAIERAEIGRDQILGKRQPRRESPQFRPEFAAEPGLLARQRGVVFYIYSVSCEHLLITSSLRPPGRSGPRRETWEVSRATARRERRR